MTAAGEQSFESALSATLEDLELSFSLRKEQRTALKSFLKKGRCVRRFAGQIWQKLNLSTSSAVGKTLWLVEALSYCVQREFERQPFIPPLGVSVSMVSCQTKHLDVVWLARLNLYINLCKSLAARFTVNAAVYTQSTLRHVFYVRRSQYNS